jgi:hypothetical protein
MGYSSDSMGILLMPANRAKSTVNAGSLLDTFTIVFDDRLDGAEALPQGIRELYHDIPATAVKSLVSPDGYSFSLKPYSIFLKESTSIIPDQ